MTPFFDIIVPVYNQVGKMDKCIDSLKKQTFSDFRAIFVNDGSKDESLKMLEGYAKDDPRFIVTGYDINGSLVKARFTGMKEVTGEYVLFLDSDDYLSEDALLKIKGFVDKDPVDYLSFDFISEPEGIKGHVVRTEDVYSDILSDRIKPAIWKCAYSKRLIEEALKRISPFYCNMGEDSYFSTVFTTCAKTFGTLDEILYHYELGTGMSGVCSGVSKDKLKRDMDSLSEAAEHILSYLKEYAPKYLEPAKKHIDVMLTYECLTAIYYDDDMTRVIDNILCLKELGFDKYFGYAATRILPEKIGREMLKVKENTRAGAEFLELLNGIKTYEG